MRTKQEVIQAVLHAIEAHREEILGFGEYFWKNPEPGYREFKTSGKASEVLSGLGLSVRDHLSITGMRADLDTGRKGPVLALLGEMDSLILPSHPECDPKTGAVHSCGHHSHITALLGAAIALVESEAATDLSGKIAFIPVPAEECIEVAERRKLMERGEIKAIGGKASMIREGIFDDVSLALMNHLSTGSAYTCALHNGFVIKAVTFHGKSCHAARPDNGINALNICTLAQNALALLRETFTDPSIRVHGMINSGGDSVNIIPDNVSMEYLLRASSMEKIKELSTLFDRAMHGAAAALGGSAEVTTTPGYAVMKDHQGLWKAFEDAVRILHPQASFHSSGAVMSSTDMGDVSQIVPTVHSAIPGAQGTSHGKDYQVKDTEQAYLDNTRILALTAVELLYGDASRGSKISASREGLLSIPEYITMMDSLS